MIYDEIYSVKDEYFIRIPQPTHDNAESSFGVPKWIDENYEIVKDLDFDFYPREYSNEGSCIDFDMDYDDEGNYKIRISGTGVDKSGNKTEISDEFSFKVKAL